MPNAGWMGLRIPSKLKISIVIPTYDNEVGLRHAVNSVLTSSDCDIELIIVDGGLSDETRAVVESFDDAVSHFISEPDRGYADAFNKGVRLATGSFVMMLADDDVIIPGALTRFASSVDQETDIWSGHIIAANQFGFHLVESDRDLRNLETCCSVRNPATLYKRDVFDIVGEWDTSYRCANDMEFLLRCYKAGLTFQVEDVPIVIFREGGLSSSYEGRFLAASEEMVISMKYGLGQSSAHAIYSKRLHAIKRSKYAYGTKWLLWRLGLLPFAYRVLRKENHCLSKRQLARYGCTGSIPPYSFDI